MENKASNYDRLCDEWAEKFTEMNKSELMKGLPEIRLNKEKNAFVLKHFDRTYCVSFETGKIFCVETGKPAERNPAFNIYTLFAYAKENARLSGEWVPFEKLRNASPFEAAYKKNIILPLGAAFDGKGCLLEEALIKMGGKKINYAEVGYEIKAFECIPMRILFWNGDEEFASQANVLFDMSATDFIHVESTVSIASEALERLCSLADVELRGGF